MFLLQLSHTSTSIKYWIDWSSQFTKLYNNNVSQLVICDNQSNHTFCADIDLDVWTELQRFITICYYMPNTYTRQWKKNKAPGAQPVLSHPTLETIHLYNSNICKPHHTRNITMRKCYLYNKRDPPGFALYYLWWALSEWPIKTFHHHETVPSLCLSSPSFSLFPHVQAANSICLDDQLRNWMRPLWPQFASCYA